MGPADTNQNPHALTVQEGMNRAVRKAVVVAQFTRPADTNAYAISDTVCNSTSAPVIMTFQAYYEFEITTALTVDPTAGAIYSGVTASDTFLVVSTNLSSHLGIITCIRTGGTADFPKYMGGKISGTLTNVSGTGDASIVFFNQHGGNLPNYFSNGAMGYITNAILRKRYCYGYECILLSLSL